MQREVEGRLWLAGDDVVVVEADEEEDLLLGGIIFPWRHPLRDVVGNRRIVRRALHALAAGGQCQQGEPQCNLHLPRSLFQHEIQFSADLSGITV